MNRVKHDHCATRQRFLPLLFSSYFSSGPGYDYSKLRGGRNGSEHYGPVPGTGNIFSGLCRRRPLPYSHDGCVRTSWPKRSRHGNFALTGCSSPSFWTALFIIRYSTHSIFFLYSTWTRSRLMVDAAFFVFGAGPCYLLGACGLILPLMMLSRSQI